MLWGSKAVVCAIKEKVRLFKMFTFSEHNKDSVLLLESQK